MSEGELLLPLTAGGFIVVIAILAGISVRVQRIEQHLKGEAPK